MALINIKTAEDLQAEAYAAKVKAMENIIDDLVDDTAKEKGYGTKTMSPTAACIAYAGYTNPYQAEAIAFGQWKASIWPIVFQIQMDYEAAVLLDPATPEPTLESIMAALPVMVWP